MALHPKKISSFTLIN